MIINSGLIVILSSIPISFGNFVILQILQMVKRKRSHVVGMLPKMDILLQLHTAA